MFLLTESEEITMITLAFVVATFVFIGVWAKVYELRLAQQNPKWVTYDDRVIDATIVGGFSAFLIVGGPIALIALIF
jgi:hypothetical protein